MTLIQLRRGTAAAWTTANPILHVGEPGVELDTGYEKIGDGETPWVDLGYTKGTGSGGAGIVEQDDPPSSPAVGGLWIDTDDPGPSGASVTESVLCSFLSADTADGATRLVWDAETVESVDFHINADGDLEFDTACRAQIAVDSMLTTDGSATDGFAQVNFQPIGTPLPAVSLLNNGNDTLKIPTKASLANSPGLVTLPADSFDVGNVFKVVPKPAAGSVTWKAGSMLYVVRIA